MIFVYKSLRTISALKSYYKLKLQFTRMEIDQQSAVQLLEQCATLIIAGVPDKTEFGIDLYSISVTEEFRGNC